MYGDIDRSNAMLLIGTHGAQSNIWFSINKHWVETKHFLFILVSQEDFLFSLLTFLNALIILYRGDIEHATEILLKYIIAKCIIVTQTNQPRELTWKNKRKIRTLDTELAYIREYIKVQTKWPGLTKLDYYAKWCDMHHRTSNICFVNCKACKGHNW